MAKKPLNYAQVQENLLDLSAKYDQQPATSNQQPATSNQQDYDPLLNFRNYISDFLRCFNTTNSSLNQIKNSDSSEIPIKAHSILFKYIPHQPADEDLNSLKESASAIIKKYKIRFLFLTNLKTILVEDLDLNDCRTSPINELEDDFELFLPLAGIERTILSTESAIDIKASNKMARLFDLLKKDNPVQTAEEIHQMNTFLSRVLFCFFAEDTGIFKKDQFTQLIVTLTKPDGSDTDQIFKQLFQVLNSPNHQYFDNTFKGFPYVNGGLFSEELSVPKFNLKSRHALIECGKLNWAEINPDIFGSMFQAVTDPKIRGEMGMHYTSVTNIMKVLKPLFLDKFAQEIKQIAESDLLNRNKIDRLNKLRLRLSQIKIGDMACGSGNFLIIAYRELCGLEMQILRLINQIKGAENIHQSDLMHIKMQSLISLNQFYGIEYDDFAHQIAILSLWLTEHQINLRFKEEFDFQNPTLPLKPMHNIHHGNALRLNWEEIMPNDGEVYIVGNPPFLGARYQSKEQKDDLALVCNGFKKFKNLDFVSAWFIKASRYISKNKIAECALVATNSICQGDSVGLLWENIFKLNIEIAFAYTSFKWTNNAKNNAGVTCVIIGLRQISNCDKFIFENNTVRKVNQINAYLSDSKNILVSASNTALNKLPPLIFGNQPIDNGHLILSHEEYLNIQEKFPTALKFIKKYIGAYELINNQQRFCLWIEDKDIDEALSFNFIQKRIEKIKLFRLESKAKSTQLWADQPHKFVTNRYQNKECFLIPSVSSERREYIPMAYFNENTVSSNTNFVGYDFPEYVFALLSNKMHTLWVKKVGGRLKTDYRYSNSLCYNTFPVPDLTDEDKEILSKFADDILDFRAEQFQSLAELYDPQKMPAKLRDYHQQLDAFIDNLYLKACKRTTPFQSDNERLEVLFAMYMEMTKQN